MDQNQTSPEPSQSSAEPTSLPELPAQDAESEASSSSALRPLLYIIGGVLLVAAVALLSFFYLKANAPKPAATPRVKVGVMMAFSGGSSSMGYGANKGIQLAKKQLGADNIEIVQADSKCDPKTAAEAVKRLIKQKVIAIIGEGCSSASVAALPAANNAKIPMISPSASSPTLSIPDDYFFRVIPSDTVQGRFIAQAIFDKGIRNVAVFYTNEPYGTGMNKVFQEKFEALGGKVIVTTSGEPDVIALAPQIAEMKETNPQAIFIAPNSVVSGTAVVKLAREAGMTVPLFGADIFYDTTVIKNAGSAAAGLTVTSFPTGKKSFKQALISEYKVTEQLYAAPQAYDAFHLIYNAVKDGVSTGEELKARLPSMTLDGVSARIKFDQNGEISDPEYKYDLFTVRGNQFEVEE